MHIQSETRDSVLIWQINRPDRRNALGPILAQELLEKLNDLQKKLPTCPDHATRPRLLAIKAVTAKGDSEPVWIAGGDLKELNQLKDPHDGRKYAETMAQVCQGLQTLSIPVVALIDGLVIGGGVEFALSADFRFATKRSTFHFKQLELGLATAYASAGRLTHLLGASKSLDWLVRSSKVTASKAYDAGLVNELVDDAAGLEKELDRLLADISRLNPDSLTAQKKLMNLHSSNAKIAEELDIFESLWMNKYHQDSLQKFLSPGGKSKEARE